MNTTQEIDNITGEKMNLLLQELQEVKTLIRMVLLGSDFERLTFVTRLDLKNKSHFCIDYPEGFKEIAGEMKAPVANFEFTLQDNLPYSFSSEILKSSNNEIMVKMPESIYRLQRRSNFRVKPPSGTKIKLAFDSHLLEMDVINISQGGSLGTIIGATQKFGKQPTFRVGWSLENVELIFPKISKLKRLKIKKATVVRIEENTYLKEPRYAFQFITIGKTQRKVLTTIIYALQREYLRSRLPLQPE